MKKTLLITVIITLSLFSFLISGCGNDVEKQDYDNVKTELDKVKDLQSDASSAIENLKQEITALEIEKQKLLAEKKRLEAEIIELKIKDYEEEMNAAKTDNSVKK